MRPTPPAAGDAVAVFSTCVVDVVRPGVTDRALAVLRDAGCAGAAVGPATCCGQPAANAGAVAEARRVARHTLRALAKAPGAIVVLAGSCTAMIRHQWPTLFARTRDEARARAVASRTFELTEFLATRRPAVPPAAHRGLVAYHASCHLTRQLGVRDEPLAALGRAGYTVATADDGDRCCGFGGMFALKFPDVSRAMADEKLDRLGATDATTVTSCDLSCLVQLETRARTRHDDRRFVHVAELL